MDDMVYSFKLSPDWRLLQEISVLDRFDGSWAAIEKREGQSLKQLKSIATIRSVGASTRIEGSKMTDEEVKVLLEKISISKLEDRDSQEVAGYFAALDLISASYKDMDITEGTIKNLHNILLKHSNAVEATRPDGNKQIVFQTTAPGYPTEDAMRMLIEWWHSDTETHPLVKCALFSYDLVSIHPFQDGNGRLSRLIATLLLLKQGYVWIQYVSFEHEIENRKGEYYQELMQSQQQRPGENIYSWVRFFLSCLNNISVQLMDKLSKRGDIAQLNPKEKAIYAFIENHPGSRSGEIAEKLDILLPTVKKILAGLVRNKHIVKNGAGAGTNYSL
ncbi:MAG: Fic family protein [Bacteroidota bacterium]|nr:Fic family protein [Bacteroidota bacterium]MDP4218557.1 Fic family protein [Bacteroidota bacterium]MDP4245986.1 Fic family protein [Bacteroidota bacterium]MDP4253835.1 Fic family protein [Bacteroidota bacterium]MDP4257759.1 Fic family protein [Bacteroidota bacterium]